MSIGELGYIYRDGEAIIREGESDEYMYVILEGKVEILQAHGLETRRLALLGEGDFFGEMEVFAPGTRNATVRALGPTRVLTVDKQSVINRIQEDPQLAEVEFTLLTKFEAGRMLYVGMGGDIEGVVSPDLVVAPGTTVRAILVNDDGISHDLYFPDFGAQSAAIGRKGQTTEVTFTVPGDYPAGAYVYYCTKPGHRQAGQEGWLIVKQPVGDKDEPEDDR